jgi:hypothetical protein
MKPVQPRIRALLTLFCVFFITLAIPLQAFAVDLVVTRYFSGLWDQTNQENQGIVLQIVDTNPEIKNAVGYWFTYGVDLESAWFIGIGQVEGPQVVLELYSVSGIAFMEDDQPDIDNVESVGSLVLSFKNCNHGTANWDLGEVGSGEFAIHKLAGLYNSRCSGGISDDTPGDARPVQLEVALEPAREGVDGKGKAKFQERADRSDFQVSAEDIADGDYDILVCEAVVGLLTVVSGEGQTGFRSPEADGKELLTFDPRECLIELHDGEGAVLTSGDGLLAPKGNKGSSGGNGNKEISVDLEATGVVDGAEGEASYRAKSNSTEFEVEVKHLPAGSYPLDVDGVERGTLEVSGGSSKGRIRFSDPQKADRLPLDFGPLGKLVEVSNGDGVVLEVFFPEE